jgi:AAA domain
MSSEKVNSPFAGHPVLHAVPTPKQSQPRLKPDTADPHTPKRGITGTDLLAKKFAAMSWAMQDMLPDVGAYLLAGKQKMGKSWFALALALAHAQGGRFLNRDIPKGNVLYLGLEDSERRMQSRILTLQPDVDRNPEILSNIRFFHATDNVPRLDNGLFEFISPYLDEVKLIVIDILQKIRPLKGSGNVYQDDYNTLGAIQTFAIKHGLCILVLHHTRKADADDVFDTLNGSGGVGGAVDGALIIARKRGEGAAILSTTGRDIPELEHGLTFKDGLWTYAGTAAEVAASAEQNEVFNLLKDAGPDGMTAAALCEDLGKADQAVRKLLRKLADSGRVRKRDTKPAPHYAICDGPLSPG